jgi:hypothetical protein
VEKIRRKRDNRFNLAKVVPAFAIFLLIVPACLYTDFPMIPSLVNSYGALLNFETKRPIQYSQMQLWSCFRNFAKDIELDESVRVVTDNSEWEQRFKEISYPYLDISDKSSTSIVISDKPQSPKGLIRVQKCQDIYLELVKNV